MKHSMRRQLMALLAGMILFALVLIGIVNYCFLGTFYTSMKEKSLLKTYDMLNAYMLSEAASGTEDAEDAEDAEEAEEADGEAPYGEKRHGGRDTEEEVFSYEIHIRFPQALHRTDVLPVAFERVSVHSGSRRQHFRNDVFAEIV